MMYWRYSIAFRMSSLPPFCLCLHTYLITLASKNGMSFATMNSTGGILMS